MNMVCPKCGFREEFLILSEVGTATNYSQTLQCPRCSHIFTRQFKHRNLEKSKGVKSASSLGVSHASTWGYTTTR